MTPEREETNMLLWDQRKHLYPFHTVTKARIAPKEAEVVTDGILLMVPTRNSVRWGFKEKVHLDRFMWAIGELDLEPAS